MSIIATVFKMVGQHGGFHKLVPTPGGVNSECKAGSYTLVNEYL